MADITRSDLGLSQYIDHTLLRPDATNKDFENLCEEAIANNFYAVCVPPNMVSSCAKLLKSHAPRICTVIGFPFGYNISATKAFEARSAIESGADELDLVINISALKSGNQKLVLKDIRAVVALAKDCPVKVILETCYLTEKEKRLACELVLKSGAAFVKTSTGFGPASKTANDVQLIHTLVRDKLGIKASGGIRDKKTALRMIALGATRLGTSHGVAILKNQPKSPKGGY